MPRRRGHVVRSHHPYLQPARTGDGKAYGVKGPRNNAGKYDNLPMLIERVANGVYNVGDYRVEMYDARSHNWRVLDPVTGIALHLAESKKACVEWVKSETEGESAESA